MGRVFNQRRPKRYPRAIVHATEERHIAEAVLLATREGCRVSIRSGGHSWAAWSLRDYTILIDLGTYNLMTFDEDKTQAIVSPSTTGKELNDFLSPKNLIFAGGHCPDVALGGFLLQGGLGWNAANWGWACEQIAAVDVVTAQGDLVHADHVENSELSWAARGAGPGFPGVVTKFHLQLRATYSTMLSSTWIYPISHYRDVMKWVVDIVPGYDEDTEIVAVSATPPLPSGSQFCIIAMFLTFKNSLDEARHALRPAAETRPDGALVEAVEQHTSLAEQYRNQAGANPADHRYAVQSAFLANDADVVSVLERAFTTLPHPKTYALYFPMNPCSRRRLPDMACSMQSDHYYAGYTIWEDEKDDDRCRRWLRDVVSEIDRHGVGAYLGDSDFQERRTMFRAKKNGERLMEIRRRCDPKGIICGYLDADDASGVSGLENKHEWA